MLPRVAHVEHRRGHATRAHVAEVQSIAVAHYLHAVPMAREIGVADELQPVAVSGPPHSTLHPLPLWGNRLQYSQRIHRSVKHVQSKYAAGVDAALTVAGKLQLPI